MLSKLIIKALMVKKVKKKKLKADKRSIKIKIID